MSAQAYQWAKRQRVGDSASKALLKTYAHWATDDGETWVTNKELELETELNIKTIRRAREKLVTLGFLVPTHRRIGGARSIIVYRINAPEGADDQQENISPANEVIHNPVQIRPVLPWKLSTNPSEFGPPTGNEGVPDLPARGTRFTSQGDQIYLTAPPNLDPNINIEKQEKDRNKQPARCASRVASFDEIKKMKRPGEVPETVWRMWCEHREAKADKVPWTRAAASVSLKRLAELAAQGQSAEATVAEAVLRGWTGLFPVKSANSPLSTDASHGGQPWWQSMPGIEARGAKLGVRQKPDEHPMNFKARVFRAAGPGAWIDQMVREAGNGSLREQLLHYFGQAASQAMA